MILSQYELAVIASTHIDHVYVNNHALQKLRVDKIISFNFFDYETVKCKLASC